MLSWGLTEQLTLVFLAHPLWGLGEGSRGKLSVIEVHPAAPLSQLQVHFFSSPVCVPD